MAFCLRVDSGPIFPCLLGIRRLITNYSGTKTAQEILDEHPRQMRACVSSILYKIARNISIRHYRSPSLQLLIIDCDPGWVCVCVCGGGGYSHFFFIRRIGPSIYRLPPKKIGNIKHPKKIFYFFATQKYSLSVHLPLEKTLKYIEKTPKTSPILSWPLKNILKSSYPQNIHFLKPPKNNVIEKFKQKKCPEPTHESNDQSTPPPPLWTVIALRL